MRKQDASVGRLSPVFEPDYVRRPRTVIDDNIGFQRVQSGRTG
jgi:hypothetical protein